MVQTPNFIKKDYDDKKKKRQEGFETYKEGFETYQECTPLKEDPDDPIEDHTVTRSIGASVVEDAQSMFVYWLIFLISAVFCCVTFPYLTIHAIVQDFKDRGIFFRLFLTVLYGCVVVASFLLLSNMTDNVGSKKAKHNKILIGMFLMVSAFFTYLSVTFSKVSGLQISEELSFGEYFDVDSAFLYVDLFGLTLDANVDRYA